MSFQAFPFSAGMAYCRFACSHEWKFILSLSSAGKVDCRIAGLPACMHAAINEFSGFPFFLPEWRIAGLPAAINELSAFPSPLPERRIAGSQNPFSSSSTSSSFTTTSSSSICLKSTDWLWYVVSAQPLLTWYQDEKINHNNSYFFKFIKYQWMFQTAICIKFSH